ncbi:MAG: hypothetical protein RR744_09795 [Cellulosilyticaceae bacterium]
MSKSKKSKKSAMTSSTSESGYGVSITSITKDNQWSESNPESVNTK